MSFLPLSFLHSALSLRLFLVPHLRQVPDIRLHTDLFQHLVSARIARDLVHTVRMLRIERVDLQQLADLALRVVDIAKHDSARRAGRSTGRSHFTVDNSTTLFLSRELALLDALHTERALLHHTT